jgi:DNA-binding NtrC family response regulator
MLAKQHHMKSILLIDDDEDDCLMFAQALAAVSADLSLSCMQSVDNLMDGIVITQPSMIFIDLHLPKKNGIECLRQIKRHPNCKDIPVVIWSTSLIPNQVLSAYSEGAHYFFAKPCSFQELVKELGKVSNMKTIQERPQVKSYA